MPNIALQCLPRTAQPHHPGPLHYPVICSFFGRLHQVSNSGSCVFCTAPAPPLALNQTVPCAKNANIGRASLCVPLLPSRGQPASNVFVFLWREILFYF